MSLWNAYVIWQEHTVNFSLRSGSGRKGLRLICFSRWIISVVTRPTFSVCKTFIWRPGRLMHLEFRSCVHCRSGSRNFEKEGGVRGMVLIWLLMWFTLLIYLRDHTSKRERSKALLRIQLSLTKYGKNVKLTTFLMETRLKVHE